MKKVDKQSPYEAPLITAVDFAVKAPLCQSGGINAALMIPPELPEENLFYEDFTIVP